MSPREYTMLVETIAVALMRTWRRCQYVPVVRHVFVVVDHRERWGTA